jgi:FMN-dependent NADH-azoreductase
MSPTILRIDASPRAGLSLSRHLADVFVDAVGQATVIRRDVAADPPPAPDGAWVQAEIVPPAERTQAQQRTLALSDVLVDEIEAADILLVSLPTYNFSIPAPLKAWLDQVVRMWRTFEIGPAGVIGRLTEKRAVVIATYGFAYEGTPLASWDHAAPLVETCFRFMGVPRIDVVRVEGQLVGPPASRAEAAARAEAKLRGLATELR